MSGINIDQVKAELGAYFRKHNREIRAMMYGKVGIDQYTRTISAVKGKFPAFHSVATHVIQGFRSQWDEFGGVKFKVNELLAYHQKGNVGIVPADIEGSWHAWMDEEDRDLKDKSISRYILEQELMPKMEEDRAILSIQGAYDSNKLYGQFGFSLNGLEKLLTNCLNDVKNPSYKVKLGGDITENNIIDKVTAFEKAIPENFKSKISKIFLSRRMFENYKLKFIETYGSVNWMEKSDTMRTVLGSRTIIPVDHHSENFNRIWTTVDGNFLKLIDKIDNPPKLTDVQKADYKLKLFFEFWLGYAFWTNQLVFISSPEAGASGFDASGASEGANNTKVYYAD